MSEQEKIDKLYLYCEKLHSRVVDQHIQLTAIKLYLNGITQDVEGQLHKIKQTLWESMDTEASLYNEGIRATVPQIVAKKA